MIPLRDNIRSKSWPVINYLLILVNVYVFYLELRTPSPASLDLFIRHWGVVPTQLFSDPIHQARTLVTATFLHGGWLHIIFNMLFLHIFGDNAEDRMGHFGYLVFYVFAGIIANGTQAYLNAGSKLPLIGASGAIAGVLGAYFFYYPHARVLTLIPLGLFIRIIEVPAFLFLGFWFVLQMFNGTLSLSALATGQYSGGIAWWAHAGGFIAGLLLAPVFGKKQSRYR